MDKLTSLIASRRFLVLAAGVLAVFAEELLGYKLSEDQLVTILGLGASWILGDSLRKTE